ncbi:MAG: hypothetical protein ACRCZP_19765 [Phycicoccus sp.]
MATRHPDRERVRVRPPCCVQEVSRASTVPELACQHRWWEPLAMMTVFALGFCAVLFVRVWRWVR